MSERNTLLRSMHDVGAAAWFGGSLMGPSASMAPPPMWPIPPTVPG